jgi:alpha-1,3-glucosyltransferase
VEDIPHVVLPTIKSAYTFVLALASMAPVLAKLARKPHPVVFLSSLVYCSLCSFMLGWHVHEKAILLTVIPLGLFACDSVRDAKTFLFLSIVGHYSLFPLLFRPTEAPLKVLLFLIYTIVSISILDYYHDQQQAARRIVYSGLFNKLEKTYLIGLIPIYVFTQFAFPIMLPQ